ncbi:MAG TPA: hypothetical protein VH575_14450 [Gemmataceae bacterium]|jgi:hypothetical protein
MTTATLETKTAKSTLAVEPDVHAWHFVRFAVPGLRVDWPTPMLTVDGTGTLVMALRSSDPNHFGHHDAAVRRQWMDKREEAWVAAVQKEIRPALDQLTSQEAALAAASFDAELAAQVKKARLETATALKMDRRNPPSPADLKIALEVLGKAEKEAKRTQAEVESLRKQVGFLRQDILDRFDVIVGLEYDTAHQAGAVERDRVGGRILEALSAGLTYYRDLMCVASISKPHVLAHARQFFKEHIEVPLTAES